MTVKLTKDFWEEKYKTNSTGWDIGHISTPIKKYINQLENKNISILIPGAGNSYEAEYLYKQGFTNITVIDLANQPLKNIKKRIPNFPTNNLIQGDFFELNGDYDLIIEQTFFCAINPSLRKNYVQKMHELLNKNGKLVGLLFDAPLHEDHPPFGGSIKEYVQLFDLKFHIKTIEPAYNSILPRKGKEVFINFIKK